jgi:cytidine deaminase
VITDLGEVFAGGYVESAAFNPSLPPLQAAIIAAVIGGMGSYTQVRGHARI